MKKYHSVTDACRQLDVQPHVLRYWEKEFEMKVKRNSAGRRIYTDAQLDKLKVIKHLIHRDKLTVKGARRQLSRMKSSPAEPASKTDRKQLLLWLKRELLLIRSTLESEEN